MYLHQEQKISRELYFIIYAFLAIIAFYLLDPTKVYKIFGYSPPFIHNVITEKYRFYSFNDFLSIRHIALFMSVYIVTMLFGYSLVQAFFRQISTNIFIKFTASFSIGYVASLGVIRIVSFLFKSGSVFLPTIIFILILSGVLLYRSKETRVTEAEKHTKYPYLLLTIFSILSLTLLFLIIQVYAGEFAWVGHGPHQYSWFLNYLRTNSAPPHFPIMNQHHDELLYTFLMLDPMEITFNPILPMWVNLAINKVSFFSLAYCMFRFLEVKTAYSVIGSLFLLFGTNSINPTKYLLLFDSSNPLAYVVHSTRIVGISVALLIVTNFLRPPGKEKFLNAIFFVFMGVGLVFTTISNYAHIISLFVIIMLFLLLPKLYDIARRDFKIKNIIITPQSVIHLVFIGSAVGYGILNTRFNYLPGIVHLTIFLLLLTIYIHYVLKNRDYILRNSIYNVETRTTIHYFLFFIFAILFSSLFFANLFSHNFINKALIGFLDSNTFLKGITFDTQFVSFDAVGFKKAILFLRDDRDLGRYNEYCKGFLFFLGYYGAIYLMSLFPHVTKNEHKTHSNFVMRWNALQLFMISILPILFFHTDFFAYTNYANQAWLKTRFLEVPLYLIIFSSIVLISRSTSAVIRKGSLAFQLLFILLPIIFTMRLHQWLDNAKELIKFLD